MGKCSFKPSWLSKVDNKGYKVSSWGRKRDDDNLWCMLCEASININKGYQAIKQHFEGKKHSDIAEIRFGPRQLHLTGMPASAENVDEEVESKSISLFNQSDRAGRAEIIWVLKCIGSNYSANSCNGVAELFQAMFTDAVPDDFSMCATKFFYLLTDALGPYFREKMLDDAQKSYYSLLYDETTNNEGKKELQIAIKYWSEKFNEVIVTHLETIFMGSATAEELASSILTTLDNASLCLNKLIMIGSDGPPVNAKVFRIINDKVKILPGRNKGLLQVGTCNLHVVNNAFLKGLEAYGSDVSELIISLYYYFHGWPLRNEEYSNAQIKKNVPQHKFIKHSSTRWLTLKAAAVRVLEQWPAILYYFLEYIPAKRTQKIIAMNSYNRIVKLLQIKTLKIQLIFIISSAEIFSTFNTIFQKEEPLIHALYDELKNLLFMVIRRVCKKKFLDSIVEVENNNIFDEENLLFSKDVKCGAPVIAELQKLPEKYQKDFLHNARSHYVACGKYLIEKIFVDSSNLKYLNFLQCKNISNEKSIENLIRIAQTLPGSLNVNILMDEFHLLQSENLNIDSDVRIDHFWRHVFEIKNAFGQTKYPVLQNMIKMCLSVSHGSADIERGFSLSRKLISKDKTKMCSRTLNAKLYVINALKFYNYKPQLVPITSELLTLARGASKSYKLYLEDEKRKKDEQRKREDEQRKKLEEEEEKRKAIENNLRNIKELEGTLAKAWKEENEKKKVCDKLLEEANSRLKEGIKNEDFTEIRLAQAMIEGAKTVKAEENDQRAKTLTLEKKLQKRKSSVITNFFEKKSRKE